MMKSISLSFALLASLSVAHAQEASPKVSDGTLSVAKHHRVTISLASGRSLAGVAMAYDAENVTVVEDGTDRIITVSRSAIVDVVLRDPPPASLPPPRPRHLGLLVGAGPGNVFLDLDYHHFYGFVGTSIGFPIIFKGHPEDDQSGTPQYFAFAVGAGGTWKLSPTSNWKFDLTGTLTPTWWGGFSAGVGVAVGLHYTSPNGFTFGFKLPVFGVAPGENTVFNSQTNNAVNSASRLITNYFIQAGMSLPVLSVGYRF